MNEIAHKIKKLVIDISPLIESYTIKVCPECEEPCCRQRFGIYEREDIVFLDILNEDIVDADNTINPEEACQFLSSRGCLRPRWLRPFRCTWFFCTPLMDAILNHSAKDYRKLVDLLNKIKELRLRLLHESAYIEFYD